MYVWVAVGAIDCVTVGMGGDVRNGVLVPMIEFVIGSGDDIEVRSSSISDTLEQLAVADNSNNNKKHRCIKITLPDTPHIRSR